MTQTELSTSGKVARVAEVSRKTKETDIFIRVNLDDPSNISIDTDLPFFSHMLNALATHGRIGMVVKATGDIEVDPHHLIEDTGIVLGEAIFKALGGLSGIQRAGCFMFPMDGTLAQVAIDLCGRRNLVWNVKFGNFTVGNLDPNLFREFYKGFVDGLKATLHINVLYSDNDHHVVESIFKSLSRALRQAITPIDSDQCLSTKGMLDEN